MANENRLIDANEALRMIENSRTDNPYFNGKTTPIWEKAHDCAISCVIGCPTVDAVEVVHGRWKERRVFFMDNEVLLGYRCSNCNLTYDAETNYCPNCGAKMDGVADENL